MKSTASATKDRVVSLDNLRFLMVLLVLVFHAGASYGAFPPFWPFREASLSEVITHIMPLFDVFMMSILFFIAGYFALPSLRTKGGPRFLREKFRRLGIPWLVVTLLVLPVLDYIHYYRQATAQGLVPRGYGMHWWLAMKKIGAFQVGRMNMSGFLDMTESFYQRYMWFLSLLLLLFILFWLAYAVSKRRDLAAERPVRHAPSSGRSIFPALALVGLSNVLLFVLVKILSSSLDNPFDMVWFSLGNLVQFELAKLAFYVPYFGLGVYAYSKQWFAGGGSLGRAWAWGGVCFLLTAGTMLVARTMTRAADPSFEVQLAFAVLYPLWTFSFLGLFTALAARRWNRATSLSRKLAANSYHMYLAHYVFVLTLPLLLAAWKGGPPLVKFGVVAAVTILMSYGVSEYLLKPHARLMVLGLGTLSVLLAVLV